MDNAELLAMRIKGVLKDMQGQVPKMEMIMILDQARELLRMDLLLPEAESDEARIPCFHVFKGPDCDYSGPEKECDKSLADCRARNNIVHFGGWPQVKD